MNRQRKQGFTLVEVMVVAIIVAILAAVAIPLMSANKKRAMASEAEAALGTIRSALRTVYAQTADYTKADLSGTTVSGGGAAVVGNVPGFETDDLKGRWFIESDYTVETLAKTTYTVQAKGRAGTEVEGVTITLNQDGAFSRTGL